MIKIRPARLEDDDAIWRILEPTIRAGETYPLPRDMGREAALAYWHSPGFESFVAEDEGGAIVGTYYLRANSTGAAAHVANCGYMSAPWAWGKGVAQAMCRHSLVRAKERGFRAMQFNLVISTNARAVRVWQHCGFEIVGRLPGAFEHPTAGFVDAYVMFQTL
ncbi:MAG TPA: GNAT family N-acetyltransferase [Alphaproteobacteria bacterium]|nr:GNAT family N-acetyltransferase [Alphaproteobacteria bacterium]